VKRFTATLNDGSFINVQATRMELTEIAIIVWNQKEPVAYIDLGAVISAHISERCAG
jgi:hypothetical protein